MGLRFGVRLGRRGWASVGRGGARVGMWAGPVGVSARLGSGRRRRGGVGGVVVLLLLGLALLGWIVG